MARGWASNMIIVLRAGPGLDILFAGRAGPWPHNSVCGLGPGRVYTTAAGQDRAWASNHICGPGRPGLGLNSRPMQGPTVLSSSPLQDLECQIRAWVINALQMNGYFLILSLTVDRLIAVRFPLKAVVWCSAIRAKLVVGVISLIVWPLNVPFYIFNHVENKNICTLGTSGSVIYFVFPWIAIFVGFVVPFVSLVSMNAVIVVVILSRRRSRLTYAPGRRQCDAADAIEMSESTTSSSKQDLPQKHSSDTIHIHSKPLTSRDRNAIVTLLLVSFTFLFLVAPHYINMVLFSVIDMMSTPAPTQTTLCILISR